MACCVVKSTQNVCASVCRVKVWDFISQLHCTIIVFECVHIGSFLSKYGDSWLKKRSTMSFQNATSTSVISQWLRPTLIHSLWYRVKNMMNTNTWKRKCVCLEFLCVHGDTDEGETSPLHNWTNVLFLCFNGRYLVKSECRHDTDHFRYWLTDTFSSI